MKEIITNKKNLKVFGIAALVTLIVLSSFSYAYFIGSIGGSASTDVDVTTSVNERLVFTEGNPIGIHATLDNFFDGAGSLDGETTTNVKLNAGSQSSTATELYQVYFDITTNDFEYSVDNTTPELVLTITDPEGNTLTEATLPDGTTINTKTVTTLVQDGLGGTTSQSVVGFDVTEVTGIIKLYEDYEITNTNPTVATEQNWTAKVTFINLDAEQTVNEGKTFNANLLLQQDKLTAGNKMISGPAFAALTSDYRIDMISGNPSQKELHKIIFNDTINEAVYNSATEKWDVSEAQDESVVAYIVNENTDNVMYIEANGKIIANEIQGVMDMDFPFSNTSNNEPDPTVNNISSLLSGLYSLKEINFNNAYDTSKVTDMSGLFAFLPATLLNLDLSSLKTSNVINMDYMFMMFHGTSLDISTFNTSKLESARGMFLNANRLENININNLDTSNVTDMKGMFAFGEITSNEFEISFNHLDTSNVIDMSFMFYGRFLDDISLTNFVTSKVTDMSYMFGGQNRITSLNLSSFDTSKVTNMSYMFVDMQNLITLNVSSFNTNNVNKMSNMFSTTNSLVTLDLSSFDTSNVTDMELMFFSSNALTEPLYAKTQADADKFNDRATTNLKDGVSFTVN